MAETPEGRLKQISETKVARLAHRSDSNPFSFVNAKGEPDGYIIDRCKFVVRIRGRGLICPLAMRLPIS